ncbi:hypothetical protein JCM6882_006409 [Rhodosporidiobolus microsporus]
MSNSHKSRLPGVLSYLSPHRIYRFFFPSPPGGLAFTTQGDTVLGLQKRHEAFLFFHIEEVDDFKRALKQHLVHDLTSTADVVRFDEEIASHRAQHPGKLLDHVRGLNLAFSAMGLAKLGVHVAATFLPDKAFREGQQEDAFQHLGDPRGIGGLTTWKDAYKGRHIDGVFLLTAPTKPALDHLFEKTLKHLSHSITLIKRKDGHVRPPPHAGHEHFGFRDGVTRPSIVGFNDAHRPPGAAACPAGTFFLQPTKEDGEEKRWTEGGSFMVFRELQQKVPEFERFCQEVAREKEVEPEVIAARTVGRWKNGVPLALSPEMQQGELASDVRLRDGFDFSSDLTQEVCPYAAHVRKANPRKGTFPANLETDSYRILRSGIAYGSEVTPEERLSGKTEHDRGLFFVCYQSSIEAGFQHIQMNWLNNARFPFNNAAKILEPGQDLIAGQNPAQKGGTRTAQGIKPGDPLLPTNTVSAPPFVVPRGGEYFFMPSIPGVKHLAGLETSKG